MAQGNNHKLFQDSWFQYEDHIKNNHDHDEKCTPSPSSSSSIGEESTVSNGSSISSSDMADDALSSASSSFSANSNQALHDMSEIMAHLPIKRGLSKFYQGKSESFTALSRVTSIEDLAKKATPCNNNNNNRRNNLKGSKSIGTSLHSYKPYTLVPKAIIAKKATRGSCFSSKRGSFMNSKPN